MKTNRVFKVSSRKALQTRGTLKDRIVEAARGLFLEAGFVRVRSEDIAARLGISKATLYREFPSKDAILHAVVGRVVAETSAAVEEIVRDGGRDFVEKMIGLTGIVKSTISHMQSPLGRDVEKCAPEIWKEIDAFRRKMILANFKTLLGAGVREGVLRRDVDQDLIVLIWVTLVQSLLTPGMILRLPHSADAAFETMIKIIFEGLLTKDGRRRYTGRPDSPFVLRKEVLP